jgi:hypothetical protein
MNHLNITVTPEEKRQDERDEDPPAELPVGNPYDT